MKQNAEDLAFGNWPDILTGRGMDSSFFNGKCGPCPLCGGTDRYRWNQRKFGGVWVCNGCTAGKYASGFSLLMKHMGYRSFHEAADDVRDFFGANPSIQPISRESYFAAQSDWTPEKIERNLERMVRMWNQAQEIKSGDPVSRYMQNRVPGMNLLLQDIRFHPALEYWAPPVEKGGRPVLLGKFPAMLACARDVQGNLVQLHKTYLTPDGHKANVPLAKKTDLGVGETSFAVRMMEPMGDKLGVCEGLESGWASAMLDGIPVWPCLNGPALAKFTLPHELLHKVKTLVIFADSDELKKSGSREDGSAVMRRAGSTYAAECAQTARQMKLRCLIVRPAKVGNDFADFWKERVAA